MFRRRDEEENVFDAANAEVKIAENNSASFGNFMENDVANKKAELKAEIKKEPEKNTAASVRNMFGIPTAKTEEKPASEAAKPLFQPAAEAVPQTPASPLFARPPASESAPKASTYKLSAGGALTPATTSTNPNLSANNNINSAQNTTGAAMTTNIDKIETEKRLTVGYGITLEGKISNCDKLIVYGYVHADLTDVKTLHISESGKFSGFAAIENAEISGAFEGDLIVENSIVINSTGKMSGKVTYGSIEIKPGGKFTGQIVDAADAEPDARVKKTAKKKSDEEFKLSPEPIEAAKEKEQLFA